MIFYRAYKKALASRWCGDGAGECSQTRLTVPHLYPAWLSIATEVKIHAVSATSTKVPMYRIFTRTAVRFFPEQKVSRGTYSNVCLWAKLPSLKYESQSPISALLHNKLLSADDNRKTGKITFLLGQQNVFLHYGKTGKEKFPIFFFIYGLMAIFSGLVFPHYKKK